MTEQGAEGDAAGPSFGLRGPNVGLKDPYLGLARAL